MLFGSVFLIVLSLVVLIVLVFVFLVLVVVVMERRTVYCPDLEPEWLDPKDLGAATDELEDVTVTTEDGVKLQGWFYRTFLQKLIAKVREDHENKKAGKKPKEMSAEALKDAAPLIGSPTVLYLHGNSGNISHRYPILRDLADGTQFNIFIVDYRGYGKSEGKPSEEGLKKDAEAMLHALLKREDIDKKRIIVYGQGIGAHLAFHLATNESTKNLFQAMVIENTFSSIHDMAVDLVPSWLTFLSRFVKAKFDSLGLLQKTKLEIPTLFVASAQDEVVPHAQMRALFRAARRAATPECKTYVKMYRYEGKDHHRIASINQDAFYKNLLDWSCKVLLHDSCTEEEMRQMEEELQMGNMDDVVEEEPELLPGEEEDEESDVETVGAKEEETPAATAAAQPESEIHKRKGGKKDRKVDA